MQRRPGTMELTINNRCGPSPGRPIRRCPLNVPPVVTRYRLGRKIGSGSFGSVYLVTKSNDAAATKFVMKEVLSN